MTAATARPADSIRVASSMPASAAALSQATDCSGVRIGSMGGETPARGLTPVRRRLRASLVALADGSSEADLAVVDSEVEAAVGIGADPGLVRDRSPLAAVVGEGDEAAFRAF